MFVRTDDPLADFSRHDAEQQRALDRLPKCCHCKEPIQDEHCCELDGEIFHCECFVERHTKLTENYCRE